nr:hypothetical protein [Calliblepharis sp.]
MSNCLPQITFFNEYIISPLTWFHYFINYQKIFILFFYLCFFYYLNIIYNIIIINMLIVIIISLTITTKKPILNLNILLLTVFFTTNIFLFYNYKNIKNFNTYKTLTNEQNISKKKAYSIIIPKFLLRSILIPVTSYLCLKLLFLTTKYEYIILHILFFIKSTKNSKCIEILFIFTIASQCILLIAEKISLLTLTVFLRNMDNILISNQKNILFFTFIEILNFSNFHIKRISYILYIKKIYNINFSTIDL